MPSRTALTPPQLTPAQIQDLYARLRAGNPEPTTELNYTNPFTLLVAVVCSAQMTDTGVNRATAELFQVADTPQAFLDIGAERVGQYLKTINFHGTKTKNVMALCRILVDQYQGNVPNDHAALVTLPGVGNKTANVVMNTAFGAETIAVDTHIFRVANRTGLTHGTTPDQVEQGLLQVTPKEFRRHAHHWLLLHGRYVCKARTPDCPNCVIRDICLYPDKTDSVVKSQPRKPK